MPRKRNPFLQWTTTTVCLVLMRVLRCLPLSFCRWFGRVLGRLGFYAVPRVRRVALTNLDLAYGDDLDAESKRRIALEAAENLGIVAAEFPHLPRLRDEPLDRFAAVTGTANIDPERGWILISAHLGNWEWISALVTRTATPVTEVVRPLDDTRLDRAVDRTRRASGIGTISKHGAGRRLVRLLREGNVAGILVDQSPRRNGVPVRFFGQDTWGTIGPAMAAQRTGCPIHPVAMIRGHDGRYTLNIRPALELADTGDLRQDLVENSQRCQDAVEALIRAHPGQWLWMHRRWKPRPNLAAEWRERNKNEKKEAAKG